MKEADLIKDWILKSGIQNKDGSFNAWYNLNKSRYHSVYSEITGYGITTLLYLGKIEKAKKAADWIIKNAMHKLYGEKTGGVKTRLYFNKKEENSDYSFDGGRIYTFDTGMVLFGMISLYEKTKIKRYLNAAIKMGHFIACMQKECDGSFWPYLKGEYFECPEDKWSTSSEAYHAKLAMGLIKLGEITKEEEYITSARDICNYALLKQEDNGRFITLKKDVSTNLHPHCYAAEGLLYAGIYFEEEKYIRCALRAFRWAYKNIKYDRIDAIAQILRLGLILNYNNWLGKEIISKKQINRLVTRLIQAQRKFGQQKGGILYNYQSSDVNSWVSMFALQALMFIDEIDMELLI